MQIPIIKNIAGKSIANDIQPLSTNQLKQGLFDLFLKLQELTGYKVVVSDQKTPMSTMIPDKFKQK